MAKGTKDGAMDGLAGLSILPWMVWYGGQTVTRGGPTMVPWIVWPDQLKHHKWSRGTTCGSHNRSRGAYYGGTSCGVTDLMQDLVFVSA